MQQGNDQSSPVTRAQFGPWICYNSSLLPLQTGPSHTLGLHTEHLGCPKLCAASDFVRVTSPGRTGPFYSTLHAQRTARASPVSQTAGEEDIPKCLAPYETPTVLCLWPQQPIQCETLAQAFPECTAANVQWAWTAQRARRVFVLLGGVLHKRSLVTVLSGACPSPARLPGFCLQVGR